MNLNYQLSLEIAQAINAQLGQCYYNAFRAMAMVSSNPVVATAADRKFVASRKAR